MSPPMQPQASCLSPASAIPRPHHSQDVIQPVESHDQQQSGDPPKVMQQLHHDALHVQLLETDAEKSEPEQPHTDHPSYDSQPSSRHLRPPPVFPNTTTRQRCSNLQTDNPELEFHRTALSACRSTIAQQEAELKRLNEAMDIRYKRILQLESQLGQSCDLYAQRDVPEGNNANILKSVSEKLDNIAAILASSSAAHTANNIVINSCSANPDKMKQSKSVMIQTNTARNTSDEPIEVNAPENRPCSPPTGDSLPDSAPSVTSPL